MTRCPSAEQLAELASGLAGGDARDALAAHVEGCPQCSTQLAALAATWEQLDAWQVAEPRSGLAAEFRLLLDAEPQTPVAAARRAEVPWRLWLAIAAALALVAVLPAVYFNGNGATLALAAGKIEVRDSVGDAWRPASLVTGGQSVRTIGAATLHAPDGSRVELQSGNISRLDPSGTGERLHLFVEAGRAEFDVAPDARAFVVETTAGQVRVVGTYFGVEASAARPDLLVAWVQRGKVEVSNDRGTTVLEAGQCCCCARRAGPAEQRFEPGGLVFVRNEHHPTVAFLARVHSTSPQGVRVTVRGQPQDLPYDRVFVRPLKQGLPVQVSVRTGQPLRPATLIRVIDNKVQVRLPDGVHRVEPEAVHIEVDSK